MTDKESFDMASQLLAAYGQRSFDVSMPDQESYEQMRTSFDRLGRSTEPDGEFFVVRVLAHGDSAPITE